MLEAEPGPESCTCGEVSSGSGPASDTYRPWGVHNASGPRFSHLYVGVITASSQESRDEQENKGLAPCPAVVVSVAVINRLYQPKPGLQVLAIP